MIKSTPLQQQAQIFHIANAAVTRHHELTHQLDFCESK
jgi:hypothetical protein